MKYAAILFSVLIFTLTAGPAKAYEGRTASKSVEYDCLMDIDMTKTGYKYGRNYLDTRTPLEFDQPAQWDNTRWDPEVWQQEYGTYWNADKVLTGLFHGGYFTGQHMHCDTPYVSIGTPFFDLGEADQKRALRLLAEHTGVLSKYRSFKVYSPHHRMVVGSFSRAGLHIY